jgi:hypothetical protein
VQFQRELPPPISPRWLRKINTSRSSIWSAGRGRTVASANSADRIKLHMVFPDATGYETRSIHISRITDANSRFYRRTILILADEVLQRILAGDLQFDVDLRSKFSRFLMTMIHRSPEGMMVCQMRWISSGLLTSNGGPGKRTLWKGSMTVWLGKHVNSSEALTTLNCGLSKSDWAKLRWSPLT